MTNGPQEPSSDIRQAARGIREVYVALTQEGFSSQEALVIVGQILAANGSSSS